MSAHQRGCAVKKNMLSKNDNNIINVETDLMHPPLMTGADEVSLPFTQPSLPPTTPTKTRTKKSDKK
jgi:hypothetical protein